MLFFSVLSSKCLILFSSTTRESITTSALFKIILSPFLNNTIFFFLSSYPIYLNTKYLSLTGAKKENCPSVSVCVPDCEGSDIIFTPVRASPK